MPKSESSDALKQAEDALKQQELEPKTAELAKKKREQEEPPSPLAKAKEDAEARKSIDKANQESAEAQQKEWSALVPDLGKVTDKPLKVEGNMPLFGPSLVQRAVAGAAKGVAAEVAKVVSGSSRILVTDDAELATSDAVYIEVLNGLAALIAAAEGLIEDLEPTKKEIGKPPPSFAGTHAFMIAPVMAEVGVGFAKALASALPGALSLLTPQRTVSTSATSADDLMAAAVVAGELSRQQQAPPRVVHDDLRLLPTEGKVQSEVDVLAHKREELVDLKLALEAEKATKAAEAAELKAAEKAAEAVLPEAAVATCAARIAVIDSSLVVIDKFTTSMQTIAAGQKYSPLVAAILREQLHGDQPWFTHVLLVKAEPGSAQQQIDDRLLWFKDKFSIIATAGVTYMLIETSDSSVRAGGSIGGQAEVRGTFGKDITVGEAKVIKTVA